MNVAAAITETASTLRDGRYAAFRIPSRDIDHQPPPDRIVRDGRRSHHAREVRAEVRSSAPAPKKAAALPIIPTEPRISSRTAAAEKFTMKNFKFTMPDLPASDIFNLEFSIVNFASSPISPASNALSETP